MLLVVHRESGKERKENSEVDQRTISSASLERLVDRIAETERNSKARSRLETASKLLEEISVRDNLLALSSGRMGREVPERAPDPKGFTPRRE
jgi:hypothetical protein